MRAIRTTSLFMCWNTDSIGEITIGCSLSRSILSSRSAGLRRMSRRKNRLQRSAYAFRHRRVAARRIVRISSYISVLRANFQHTCRGVHHRNIQALQSTLRFGLFAAHQAGDLRPIGEERDHGNNSLFVRQLHERAQDGSVQTYQLVVRQMRTPRRESGRGCQTTIASHTRRR